MRLVLHMAGLSEVQDSKGERNLLMNNAVRNARISQIYRSDYESYWLRRSRREIKKLGRLLKHCRTFVGCVQISKEIREWCERERVLLKIPLPASQQQPNGNKAHRIGESAQRGLVLDEQPKAVNEVKPANSVTSQHSS